MQKDAAAARQAGAAAANNGRDARNRFRQSIIAYQWVEFLDCFPSMMTFIGSAVEALDFLLWKQTIVNLTTLSWLVAP